MSIWWKAALLLGCALLLGLTSAAGIYVFKDAQPPRFAAVVPGKIYRSGQPGFRQLEIIQRETGIKTIINLRGRLVMSRDRKCRQEQNFARENGMQVIPIEFRNPPTDPNIRDLLYVLDDERKYPVLIHCYAGLERTGIAIAVYRIERMGWTTGQAVREMLTNDFAAKMRQADSFDETIFVAEYQPKFPRIPK